jgi:hypothetical protein
MYVAADEGFVSGGLAGAGTGAAIGASVGSAAGGIGAIPGAAIGAGAGFLIGGFLGSSQAKAQRDAQKKAQQAAEKARIMQVMREFGRKQQADNAMLTPAARRSTNQARTAAGTVPQSGLIGTAVPSTNNGSAGTF